MRIEMGALLRQLARRDRRDERIGVDLPVRMVQGDADLDAAVLEREHVLHFRPCAELDVPVRPDLEQQLDVRKRQRPERGTRVLGEHHHLGGAERRPRFDDRRAGGSPGSALRVGNRFSNTATS